MRLSFAFTVGLAVLSLACSESASPPGGGSSRGGATASGGSGGRPALQGGAGGSQTGGGTGGGSSATGGGGGSSGSGGAPAPVEPAPSNDAASPIDNGAAPDVARNDATTEVPAAGDGGGLTSKDFVCSWVIGITTTGEWYRAGFEQVVDNARWQVTPIEMGHLEKWADPMHPIWNSPIMSACARNTRMPDRVVFMATKYEWTTLQEFIPAYVAFVNNIKTKYPTVKRIDLMTYGRAPGNMECRGANRPSYSWIKPVQDEAAQMIAAMYPGFVFVCPKWEHKSCSDFELCPHVTAAANMTLARTIGEYFLQN
ncbi:MAG TPA: hypothetical protein VGG33_28865 [Polyangia bacterium]